MCVTGKQTQEIEQRNTGGTEGIQKRYCSVLHPDTSYQLLPKVTSQTERFLYSYLTLLSVKVIVLPKVRSGPLIITCVVPFFLSTMDENLYIKNDKATVLLGAQ